MTTQPDSARRGRRNTRRLDLAAWAIAPLVLAFLSIPVPILADNPFFFAAHGISALTFAIALAVGVGLATACVWVVLLVVGRLASPRAFDIVASSIVGISAAVSILIIAANLATSVLGPTVAFLVAIPVSVAGTYGIVMLSRRASAGLPILVIICAVTLWPLVSVSGLTSDQEEAVSISFDESQDRPPILLVVADELSYTVVSEPDGRIRPAFENLAEFQTTATTFTEAYATANATHFAIPTMLAGVSDATKMGEYPQAISGSGGPLSWLQSRYRVATDSIYFRNRDDGVPFVDLTGGSLVREAKAGGPGPLAMLTLDSLAVIGKTALPEALGSNFPEIDDRWYDFWNLQPEESVVGIGGDFIEVLADPNDPGFVFLHSMVAHTPYVRDYVGQFWSPNSLGLREGGLGTDALVELQRQVYAAAAIDLDRQVGWYINELKRAGTFDETLIIVTADHGRTFPLENTWRVGDNRQQRWADVVHVPLLVKQPGQTFAEIVTAPRSTAQISRTILEAAGAEVSLQDDLAPALSEDPTDPITFWFDKRTGEAGVETYQPIMAMDEWRPHHFTPRYEESPFAVGLDPDEIGGAVPTGYELLGTFPGDEDAESSQQRVIEFSRDAGRCSPDDGFAMVVRQDQVIGSLAWGPAESGVVTGWGVVPETGAGDYEIWCPPS